ncbi:MAG: hypothetical protein H0T45_00520 [Pyrinomonadaceae bacterium]|nr:hypothetical protein [Pyrinomonadaceae bacterium]
MKKCFAVLLALGFALVSHHVPARGQAVAQVKSKSQVSVPLFPLEDVRPGMKGVAWSVFNGTEPEAFEVEVLGVLPGFPGPRQSGIIARLSGANVAKTFVFAGMSGSPVYIDGKLVGAIAYSFPFSREPIAGITPIRQMIDIFERESVTPRASDPRTISFTKLAATELQLNWPKPMLTGGPLFAAVAAAGSPLNSLIGQQMTPIATPVVFSGIAPEALQRFAPQLQSAGLLPVAGIGGAAAITPLAKATDKTLAPGTSISVQLVRGDYSLAASGTVTMRDGDRIYAFGHPFLGLGRADMPMSESSVVTVISNVNNSFKLATPGQMVGAVSQDRATGIFGQLGHAPKMIPVTINLRTSRDRTEKFTYEIASDQFLTPLLLNITVYSTIAATERSLGEATISLNGRIDVANHETILLERRFSSANAAAQASGAVANPLAVLLSSGFENVDVKSISLDIISTDERKAATLERIALDRTEVGRGETMEVQAYVRTDSGKQFVQRIPFTIPSDVPPGQLVLFVGDGNALQQAAAAQNFVPKDLGQLVGAINKIKKNDRLYVKLFRLTPGAVIGTDELPNLPPSMVATLNSDRSSGGYTATVLSPLMEKELPPAEFVIEGQQLIGISVIR